MLVDVPLLPRIPAQLAAWCWVILLPGVAITTLYLRNRRTDAGDAAALVLGTGLMAVPVVGYAWVVHTEEPIRLGVLALAAAPFNLALAVSWAAGLRLRLDPAPRLLWAALAGVFVVHVLVHDASHFSFTLSQYHAEGFSDCFFEGNFLYVGQPTLAEARPPITHGWDDVIRGNITLSSTHLLVFGFPGFRVLRALIGVFLGLTGWLLGRKWASGRWGPLVGLVVFGLNPYVVMIPELDRNVMALAWGAFLFWLADVRRAGPVIVGSTLGFAIGLGLQLLPAVFVVPLALHYALRGRRRVLDVAVLLALAAGGTGLWVVFSGFDFTQPWVEPFTYDILGYELKVHRLLYVPFVQGLMRGPAQPYPTAVYYPLSVVQNLGVVFLAVSLTGLWVQARTDRLKALELVLWGLPTWAVLSAISVLTADDQLRIILPGLLPVFLLAVKGMDALRSRRDWIRTAGVALALGIAAHAASRVDAPVDPRSYDPKWVRWSRGVQEMDVPETREDDPWVAQDVERKRSLYRVPALLPNYRERLERAHMSQNAPRDRWRDLRDHDYRFGPSS